MQPVKKYPLYWALLASILISTELVCSMLLRAICAISRNMMAMVMKMLNVYVLWMSHQPESGWKCEEMSLIL